MKSIWICLIAIASATATQAQIVDTAALKVRSTPDTLKGWSFSGVTSINIAQTALSNWAAGGEGSVSGTALTTLIANYSKGKNSWYNSLDLAYAVLQKNSEKLMKTDDRFDLLSKYGRKAVEGVYYSTLFNFKTQFMPGFDYSTDSTHSTSDFLAPASVIGAVGVDLQLIDGLSVFAAPLTSKTTIVNNDRLADAGSYGVRPAEYITDDNGNKIKIKDGEIFKHEVGGYVRIIYSRTNFTTEWLKQVGFVTKLDLFSNYINNPERIDINWEVKLMLKVSRVLSINLQTLLIYDDDVYYIENNEIVSGPKIQFKEHLGIGLQFKF